LTSSPPARDGCGEQTATDSSAAPAIHFLFIPLAAARSSEATPPGSGDSAPAVPICRPHSEFHGRAACRKIPACPTGPPASGPKPSHPCHEAADTATASKTRSGVAIPGVLHARIYWTLVG